MDPLQVHKNGKIFLLLDTEIGAVGHIASMAILPAGALVLVMNSKIFLRLEEIIRVMTHTMLCRCCVKIGNGFSLIINDNI